MGNNAGGPRGGQFDSGANGIAKVQEKEQYYKFYLDSAQKAIDMMRKQHKTAQIMRLNESQEQAMSPADHIQMQ